MSLHARKPLIIVFVLGACALGMAMIFAFGGRDHLSKREPFLVYFNDSVNGLVPGSLVKFKGVPIGYVDSLRLDYRQPGDRRIPVLIQVNEDRLQRQLGVLEDLSQPAVLESCVRRGLRAELTFESRVTGQMFVELDFHTPIPAIVPASIPPGRPSYLIIPTIPSGDVADQQEVQDIVAWLPTFDFQAEIEKAGRKIDSFTTAVSVIPYAEYSQKAQRSLQPLVRFNFNAWQRNFDNFLSRLNRYQSAIGNANDNFSYQSHDFIDLSHKARTQLDDINAGLVSFRASLQADDPSLAHLTHNLQQLTKDMQNLTNKLQAAEQQPRLLDKVGR